MRAFPLPKCFILSLLVALSMTACRKSQLTGTYVAISGGRLLTMEIHDSSRGVLRPHTSLTYAVSGDTLLIQADPTGGEAPSSPSRFLIVGDTLRELIGGTQALHFVRQR